MIPRYSRLNEYVATNACLRRDANQTSFLKFWKGNWQ